jgi:hypothetical protein
MVSYMAHRLESVCEVATGESNLLSLGLYIPKKDFAKPQSQKSTAYLQSVS